MMNDFKILLAGFGGQGVLFAGKVAAYGGLMEGKEISWLPSYGPEMRGGTANCSICISEKPIGSPLVLNPNLFVAMNLPSLDKFIDTVETGGIVIVDSALIAKKVEREDVSAFYIPATNLAEENDLKGLANIILIGKLFKHAPFCSWESLEQAVLKSVPKSKEKLIGANMKALQIGMEYED